MKKLAFFACALAWLTSFGQQSVDVTVRRAPYVISSVSSKTEHAWAVCKYCGSKTSYEKSFKWDVNNHKWIETTAQADIPEVCRKCRAKEKSQEKLDTKERELDRKITEQETRLRIKEKTEKLRELRNQSR